MQLDAGSNEGKMRETTERTRSANSRKFAFIIVDRLVAQAPRDTASITQADLTEA